MPADERECLGGRLRTGQGAQGPPPRPRYVKPVVLPGAKGSPTSRRCRGAKAGGSGARQGWTNGAGKSAGQGDSSLAGEGGRAAERRTPWHAAQSRLCASPGPPRPAGKRHRVAFWGRLAAGAGSRHPPLPRGAGGLSGWPGGSTLGLCPAKGRCHPAGGQAWLGCSVVPRPRRMLLPHHPAAWGRHGVSPSLCSQGIGVPRDRRSLHTAQSGPAVLLTRKGRMTRQGVGASTSGLLSCCPACPCPSRLQRRPGRVIPGHILAAGTAGGAEPRRLAQGGGHIFGPPCLQHPARWGN